MNNFFEKSWGAFFAAFVGSFLALVTIPALFLLWQQAYELYDKKNPPASMKLASYEITADNQLFMRFYVTRHDNCDFLKLQGYSGINPQQMQPSTVRRADGEQPIDYIVGITALSSKWVMYPLYGPEIRLQGYYSCGSRIVRPILISTKLTLNK